MCISVVVVVKSFFQSGLNFNDCNYEKAKRFTQKKRHLNAAICERNGKFVLVKYYSFVMNSYTYLLNKYDVSFCLQKKRAQEVVSAEGHLWYNQLELSN